MIAHSEQLIADTEIAHRKEAQSMERGAGSKEQETRGKKAKPNAITKTRSLPASHRLVNLRRACPP